MLHAQPRAERGVEEVGDIAGCEDVGCTGLQVLIHDDPVVHAQARLNGKLDVGLDANAGDDSIHANVVAARRFQDQRFARARETRQGLTCPHVHALFAVIAHEKLR